MQSSDPGNSKITETEIREGDFLQEQDWKSRNRAACRADPANQCLDTVQPLQIFNWGTLQKGITTEAKGLPQRRKHEFDNLIISFSGPSQFVRL